MRPVIEEAWLEGDCAELNRLEAISHELADLDARRHGFRYAIVQRSGDPPLSCGFRPVRQGHPDVAWALLTGRS